MTNLDSILESRDITLSTKAHIVKAMVFPVVMHGCERWTIKKAEHRRTDAFKLLEKTLESPLDSKEIKPVNLKGNQHWIFIRRTNAEAKLHYFGWLIGKDPDAYKDWRQEEKGTTRGWDGWIASLTQRTWIWANSGRWWRTGRPGVLGSMSLKESDTTEQLNNNNNILFPSALK